MSNQTIKITFKSKDSMKNFYVMHTDSWIQLLQAVEMNLKDIAEINKLRKFWIGKSLDCFCFPLDNNLIS